MAEEEKKEIMKDDGADSISFSFKLRNVPNDHSCLFHSVGYLLHYERYQKEIDLHYELRNIVSNQIIKEKEYYKNHLLAFEKDDGSTSITADDYAKLIQNEFTWGGTIEISVFAKHYNVSIVVVDITAKRFDIFNDGKEDRIYVIYHGDHYDAVVGIWNDCNDLDSTKEIRIFNLSKLNQQSKILLSWDRIEKNALSNFLDVKHIEWKQKQMVLSKMKARKRFSCQDCNMIMNDNKEMEQHMKESNFEHCMFDEI